MFFTQGGFLPSLTGMWAVDGKRSFLPLAHQRFINYLPGYYRESVFLRKLYQAVEKAFEPLLIMMDPHTIYDIDRATNEIDSGKAEGWRFERLFDQKFITLSNHQLQAWFDLLNVTLPIHALSGQIDYVLARERARFLLHHEELNTPLILRELLALLSSIPLSDIDVVETYATYTMTVVMRIIDIVDFNMANFLSDKIRNTRPAHIGGAVHYFSCALDDSPPCELDDVDAILGPSHTL